MDSIGCSNSVVRIFNCTSGRGVTRIVLGLRLSSGLLECPAVTEGCLHRPGLNRFELTQRLVSLLGNEKSALFSSNHKNLFLGSTLVPHEDPEISRSDVYAQSAARIQGAWRSREESLSHQATPRWKSLSPWPSSFRRNSAAATIQKAWKFRNQKTNKFSVSGSEWEKLVRNLSIGDNFKKEKIPDSKNSLLDFDLLIKSVPSDDICFHATRRSQDVLLSWNRRRAKLTNSKHGLSGRIFTDRFTNSIDFCVLEIPTCLANEKEPMLLGFTDSMDENARNCFNVQIASNMLSVGSVYNLRLIRISLVLYACVFSSDKLCAKPIKILNIPKEDDPILFFAFFELSPKSVKEITLINFPIGEGKRQASGALKLTAKEIQLQLEKSTCMDLAEFGQAREDKLASEPWRSGSSDEAIVSIMRLVEEVNSKTRELEKFKIFGASEPPLPLPPPSLPPLADSYSHSRVKHSNSSKSSKNNSFASPSKSNSRSKASRKLNESSLPTKLNSTNVRESTGFLNPETLASVPSIASIKNSKSLFDSQVSKKNIEKSDFSIGSYSPSETSEESIQDKSDYPSGSEDDSDWFW